MLRHRKDSDFDRPVCALGKNGNPGSWGKPFVTVEVVAVIPLDRPEGCQHVDLCQGGKCVLLSRLSNSSAFCCNAFCADGNGDTTDFSSVEIFEYNMSRIKYREATEEVAKQGWNIMKPLTAKMHPGSYLTGLPDPVVVISDDMDRTNTKVIYLPEEKRRRYGKMLDRYREVSDQGPF